MNKRQTNTSSHTSPRAKAIALAVASCFSVQALPVYANPQNPTVVAGQAVFQQAGNTLTVTNTPGAIINWQRFNIGRDEITRFIQQSATSQVLNRVTGGDPSQILGMLQSNGRVLLINPNGVVFGAGARVDVAGLLVSTLNLSNQDFLAGRLRFNGSGSNGDIVNQGEIKTASGGAVVIVAPRIENSGLIQAPDGSILLAAGQSVEITELGNPDILVEITNRENRAVNLGQLMASSVSLSSGLVRQEGVVEATSATLGEGGKIVLRAAHSIDTTATSQTRADGTKGGQIQIEAGERADLAGRISASGNAGLGGQITATAPAMTLSGAEIRADGRDGGGEVLLGGDWQGGGTLKHATTLHVDSTTKISADAITVGDGGKVVFWSDQKTTFHGDVRARGGIEAGDGGRVEVSSKGRLGASGVADSSARGDGEHGLLLIDPYDLYITSNPTYIAPDGTDTVVLTSFITGQTSSGAAVDLDADNDIVLLAGSNITTFAGGSGGDITMNAGRSISLNSNIDTDGGALALNANLGSANRSAGDARITMGDGTSITTKGGTFTATLIAAGGNIAPTGDVNSAIRLTTVDTSGVSQGAPGGTAQSAGDITISTPQGDIAVDGMLSAGGATGAQGDGSSGGATGGAGGTISLTTSGGEILLNSGAEVRADGGTGGAGQSFGTDNGGNGGAAGSLLMSASHGYALTPAELSANGGTGGDTWDGISGSGTSGGTIDLHVSTTGGTFLISSGATLDANGGSAGSVNGSGSWGTSGDGGTAAISFTGSGTLSLDSDVYINAYGTTGGNFSISADTGLQLVSGGGTPALYTNLGDNTPMLMAGTDLAIGDIAIYNQSGNLGLRANNDISLSSGALIDIGGNFDVRAGRSVSIAGTVKTNGGDALIVANDTAANGIVTANRADGAATIAIGGLIDTENCPDGCIATAGNIEVTLADGAGRTGAKILTGGISAPGTLKTQNSLTDDGGATGNITVTAHDSNISIGQINAIGQNTDTFTGGAGGTVQIKVQNASAARTISVSGDILAHGGGSGSSSGGNGGTILLEVQGSGGGVIQAGGDVDVQGGPGSANGGDAGSLTAQFTGGSGTISGGAFHTGGGIGGVNGTDNFLQLTSTTGNLTLENITQVAGTGINVTSGGQILSGAAGDDLTVPVAQTVLLEATGGIGSAADPLTLGASAVHLGFTNNVSGEVHVSGNGSVYLNSLNTSVGKAVVHAADSLHVTAAGQVQSTAGDVIVSAGTYFDNQRGTDAFDAAGRWLVYSVDPGSANEETGGLVRDFTEYNITYPTAPQGAGNGMLYSLAPMATPSFVAGSIDKVYDKTTTAPVVLADLNVTGSFPQSEPGLNDTVSLVLGTADYATSNAGSGITVTASGLGVSAVDGNGKPVYGYQLTASTVSSNIGTITPASLTVSTTDVSKVYDGTTAAAGTATVTAGTLYGGDAVSGGTYTYDSQYVGTGKTVTASGVTVNDGNGGNNYTVSYASNTASVILADPANFAWSGASTGGSWSNPANWNQGVVPVNGATVDGAGLIGPLDFGAGTLSLASLTLPAGFSMTGGSLTVGGTSSITGSFLLSGGTFGIASGGTLTVPAGVSQSGGIFHLGGSSASLIGNLNLSGGYLTGTGTISGDVVVGNGTLAPGASPGALNITGNLTLSSGSTVEIEVGGPTAGVDYDVINVSGLATLDGTLNVSSFNGYPQYGTNHQFLNFASSSGAFAVANLPAGLALNYFSTYGELQGLAPVVGVGGVGGSAEASVTVATLSSAMIDEDGTLQIVLGAPQNDQEEQEEFLQTCP